MDSTAAKDGGDQFFPPDKQGARHPGILNEDSFLDMLTLERRRGPTFAQAVCPDAYELRRSQWFHGENSL